MGGNIWQVFRRLGATGVLSYRGDWIGWWVRSCCDGQRVPQHTVAIYGGVGLGFDAATVDAFVQVYSDEENGIPSNVLVYLLATFAEEGGDEWKDDVLFFFTHFCFFHILLFCWRYAHALCSWPT